jgi:hypothetical protein
MNVSDLTAAANFLHITLNPWKFVGLAGSIIFGLRFVIQWIASERAKKSVIPIGFWECSAIRLDFDSELFCDLSARLRRHPADRPAIADLLAQFILPLDASPCATSRSRAPRRGIAVARFKVLFNQCPPNPKLFISITIPAPGSIPPCWKK